MSFHLSNSFRIQYYLGTFDSSCFYITPEFSSYILDLKQMKEWNRNSYSNDLLQLLKTTSLHQLYPLGKLKYYPHDRVELFFDAPTLVKSRLISSVPNYSILMKFNTIRHFKPIFDIPLWDIPFDQKKNQLYWRGASTGYGFGNNIPYRPSSRESLLQKYYRHTNPQIDIGLSSLAQNAKLNPNKYKHYLKKSCSIKVMLQYKYLLSVEGNDVASNLKWILFSNSVLFMPPPHIESWIMESYLIPYYHYIPIAPDFSDIEEKINWCDMHPTECKTIVSNATNYIKTFLDEQNETIIMKNVLDHYFKNVTFLDA